MNIIGTRVTLRAIEQKDDEMLLDLVNSPIIENSVVGWGFPVSHEEQAIWRELTVKRTDAVKFAVEMQGECVGLVVLDKIDWKNRRSQIGIKLSPKSQGKGIGQECLRLTIKYAFCELNLNKLEATVLEYNEKSKNMFIKCGFKEEGRLKESIFKGDSYNDLIIFGLLNRDFKRV